MPEYPEVTLSRTQVRTLRSRNEQEYAVWIAFPSEPAPSEGFPVLYLLDANALFVTVVESLRLRARRSAATGVSPAVVVGIGYPTEELFDTNRRTYDYTPCLCTETLREQSTNTGGAAAFFEFIETTIKPEIERSFSTDRTRQFLFTHSLAGFFGLHILLNAPEAFRAHIIVSPSIWWNQPFLANAITRLQGETQPVQVKPDVMLCVGEYDQEQAPWQKDDPAVIAQRKSRRMVDNARALAERIEAIESIGRVKFHEFAGEDHASVILPAVNHGLRLLSAIK